MASEELEGFTLISVAPLGQGLGIERLWGTRKFDAQVRFGSE